MTPKATKQHSDLPVIYCLALDWGSGAPISLAELFRVTKAVGRGEDLVLCLTPRTRRLFPQLSIWAEEEGFSEGLWLIDPSLMEEPAEPLVLIGDPPAKFIKQGAETAFQLVLLPGRA